MRKSKSEERIAGSIVGVGKTNGVGWTAGVFGIAGTLTATGSTPGTINILFLFLIILLFQGVNRVLI